MNISEYVYYYGDRVEVTEDILSADEKRIAKKGDGGEVKDLSNSERSHIFVQIDGKKINSHLPGWKLKRVSKNEVGRREHEQKKQTDRSKLIEMKINIGDVIKVKGIFSSRIYNVCVTEIRESGIYGYRIKSNGDRYQGKLHAESFFSILEINNAKMDIENETLTKYPIGGIVPIDVMRWDIYAGAGEVVKRTSRTIHVSYKKDEKPIIYSLKSFPRVVNTREKMQSILYGEIEFVHIPQNFATLEGKRRFEELGFDVSKVIVKEDPHKRQ